MSKLTKPIAPFTLSKPNAWWLWFCQLLNVCSLAIQLSSWMLAVLALCFCWQALLLSKKNIERAFVSPIILTLFAISGCIAIAISAKSLGVLSSMVHLLTFAYALKAFEIKKRKDFYQHMLLGLFLLASALIFKQTLVFSLLILLLVIINLTLIHKLFAKQKSMFEASKTVLMLLLQSTFLAVTLFIVFPRLSPFWQVPMEKSAKTGLSDTVSPGDIANLALSSKLAFRANFKGRAIPAYSQLYWRAMTLENYDGRKWTRAIANNQPKNSKAKDQKFKPAISGSVISYQIIAQPSFQSWLFALAVATTDNASLILKDDYTVQSTSMVNQLKHYQISSYLNAPLAITLSEQSRQRNLMIKQGTYPKLEALALTLKNKYSSPVTLSQAVLRNFREQEYYYSLQAPLLINNSLEQFYFDTKSGFCVHYASSYTYLMRAAGIPARVVTGYLGGEYNSASSKNNSSQGGHLNIYQYDAHAWSEIWIEGIGWYRVDPTAAVDPERVSQGWSTALLEQQSELNNDFIMYRLKQLAWLNTLRLKFDAIDYQWTRWVLGYSTAKQYDLLKRWFGREMPWKTAAIIACSLALAMGLFALFYRLSAKTITKVKLSPSQVLYNKCLLALKAKGTVKFPYQTTQQFSRAVDGISPYLSTEFSQITQIFEILQYQQYSVETEYALMSKLTTKTDGFIKALKRVSAQDKRINKTS